MLEYLKWVKMPKVPKIIIFYQSYLNSEQFSDIVQINDKIDLQIFKATRLRRTTILGILHFRNFRHFL